MSLTGLKMLKNVQRSSSRVAKNCRLIPAKREKVIFLKGLRARSVFGMGIEKKSYGKFVLAGGPMYGEKTGVITSQVKRIHLANERGQDIGYALFKPRLDDRDGAYIVSRADGERYDASFIDDPQEILSVLERKVHMVGIDEIELLSPHIVPVVKTLMKNGIDVYGAGLDLDFRGEPFGSMPELAALASRYEKTTAICGKCGREANFTQRLLPDGTPAPYDSPLVVIEEKAADGTMPEQVNYLYEPRCFRHHKVPGKPNTKIEEAYKKYLR